MFLFKEQLRWLFINSDDSLQIHNCIFIQTLFLQPVTKSALICDTNLNCVCHCELKDHKIYDMEKIHSVKYSWHLSMNLFLFKALFCLLVSEASTEPRRAGRKSSQVIESATDGIGKPSAPLGRRWKWSWKRSCPWLGGVLG